MNRNELFHLLNQKVRLFSKEMNDYLQQHNLYSSQWTILYILLENGPMTQTDIWKYLQVEAPTITRTLTRMEKSGWIVKKPGNDKREKIILLTDEAREKLDRIQQSVQQFENDFTTNLTTNEQQELYRLLKKLGSERNVNTNENE
ncbi:MarR family transcriptional regulator [Salibacterium salarium]|uniref:MarR family transcriptional regulator n=1 Tax=Salibacterium salarium TaxID=284579 RepID=A0A428MYC9_9BACI|nr:MarR family transcriptional regulator [Salibacterium salarium]RSL31141.1 MarR family transcriptional regulator [Salibacterium salarium]